MPGIVRKLLVFAVVDGLVLQPLAQRNQRAAAPLKIDYSTFSIEPLLRDVHQDVHGNDGLEILGIIGLLKVASSAFLVSISNRQQVAQIAGKPIYVITGISIIPVGSQAKAQAAIDAANIELAEHLDSDDADDSPDGDLLAEPDNDTLNTGDDDSLEPGTEIDPGKSDLRDRERNSSVDQRKDSIAEDVISKKGVYGRFADRWFSKRGWATGQRRNQGLSSDHDLAYGDYRSSDTKDQSSKATSSVTGKDEGSTSDAYQRWPQTPVAEKKLEETFSGAQRSTLAASLLPKLLRTTQILFTSKTFYFSYDHDITRSLATQLPAPSDLPLFKDVDPQYFWNDNLCFPLIEKGFNEYVLPIMQGFIGQREFALESGKTVDVGRSSLPNSTGAPEKVVEAAVHELDSPERESSLVSTEEGNIQRFLLTLVSRRSVFRSGLRYLRRGIDEDGHTANAVETEQILSFPCWDSDSKIHSFVQTRGSIPLFFSQIPYNFKPPPTLHASPQVNLAASRKHFSSLTDRYGSIQAISLVDKHGTEVQIGEAYENMVQTLNETGGANGKPVGFEWFEFHNACRGMKFENVSILVDKMSNFLTTNGWTVWQASKPLTSQSGVLRTNCMDCLDRTNVVQSAVAQTILELQLASAGFSVDLTSDPSTTWFNTLWADNGDAISRAYTGTSALKGDYTRTRKRNMVGALTDLTLTLSRYYHNLFDDFFAQAAIDYLLGTVTSDVFAEFEATMTTADPAIDLGKARQAAITTAFNVVVEDSEDLLHGWALKSPALPNTLRTFPFSEILLLLTDKALYNVQFDWNASKVRSFERIELTSIQTLQYGTYVTETHAPAQMDPKHNAGFIMRFQPLAIESDDEENTGKGDEADGTSATVESKSTSKPEFKKRPSIIRVNTRTLENVRDAWSITGADGRHENSAEAESETLAASYVSSDSRFWAFKALPPRSSVVKQLEKSRKPMSERESVQQICVEISGAVERARGGKDTGQENGAGSHKKIQVKDAVRSSLDDCTKVVPSDGKAEDLTSSTFFVEEKDVIGVDEAKTSTGYLERVGWGIKKAIWG